MEFTHDVTSTASPEAIFDVLLDVESWPQWTKSMTQITRRTSGDVAMGTRMRVRQPYSNTRTWVVTELVRPHTFTWESRQMGVMVVARHDITAGGASSSVRLSVVVSGALGRLVAPLSAARIRRFMELEATGLVARALDPGYLAIDVPPARTRELKKRQRSPK